MRIAVRVGGALAPSLAVSDLAVSYDGGPIGAGPATVSFTVANTGNAVTAAGQTVQIAGPFGWFGVDADAIEAVPALLPGEQWPVTVTVDGVVPAVVLTATVGLHPRLPAGSEAVPVAPVTATATTWAVPWALVAALAVLVVLIVLVVRARRRARTREQERIDAAVAAALAERTPEPV